MSTNQHESDPLHAASRRIAELETELAREREALRATRQRLATKEREVVDIHRSHGWRLINASRALKSRYLDPLLGLFGISWPRRPPAAPVTSDEVEPRGDRYDVICLSTCDWDDRFQRPQQLMARFAAAGHRVFYVSQRFRDVGGAWAATRKRENVYEVTLRGKPLNVYADALGAAACESLRDGLASLRRDVAIDDDAIVVVQLPFWAPLARRARAQFGWRIVYDCMDLHAGFRTVRRAVVAQEDALIAEADLVCATSSALEQHVLRKRGDVLLLRNACDFEHFAQTPRTSNARPVIGYYGAIAEWFDSSLVASVAARRPEWDFVLVGGTYGGDLARLAALPNVSLPGEQAYESLPEWLGQFDVGIVPFKRCSLTDATNPVKLYEMLAAGKPIVSVPIPEVAALVPLVRLASNADELEREIDAALREEEDAADARRAFAREQTWGQRFETLAGEIERIAATSAAARPR